MVFQMHSSSLLIDNIEKLTFLSIQHHIDKMKSIQCVVIILCEGMIYQISFIGWHNCKKYIYLKPMRDMWCLLHLCVKKRSDLIKVLGMWSLKLVIGIIVGKVDYLDKRKKRLDHQKGLQKSINHKFINLPCYSGQNKPKLHEILQICLHHCC